MIRQFKEGDVCVTRGGQKAWVIKDDGSALPLLVRHEDRTQHWHTRDGRLSPGDQASNLLSLAGLWGEAPEKAKTELKVAERRRIPAEQQKET